MKRSIPAILLAALLVLGVSCKQQADPSSLSPEEALKVLDAKLYKHPKDAEIEIGRASCRERV